MVSFSLPRLMAYLTGPGAKVQATLQAHCYAAMPGITAKQCSPARGLYRANGHGAQATGNTRYPRQLGSQYATQLSAAVVATGPQATAKQRTSAQAKVGKVWAKRAAKAGAKQAKAKAGATPTPTPTTQATS